MEKVLIFDTETDGLPLSFKVTAEEDFTTWPHIVQICAHLYDIKTKELIESFCEIVYPHNFIIPDNMIHGISQKEAEEKGIHISNVLDAFTQLTNKADFVLAHNYDFDYNVVTAAYLREGRNLPLSEKKSLCTQKATTDIVRIPSNYGNYKWPSLKELYTFLFKEDFSGAHSANGDVEATARCYFALQERHNINQRIY